MSDSPTDPCPFCAIPAARVIDSNDLAFAVEDAFPVAPGHTLIISRRHVESFFDLTPDEVAAVMELLGRAKARLDAPRGPDGYNVGVNVGRAAGQTVMHVHVHLIPRRAGDVSEPRGNPPRDSRKGLVSHLRTTGAERSTAGAGQARPRRGGYAHFARRVSG